MRDGILTLAQSAQQRESCLDPTVFIMAPSLVDLFKRSRYYTKPQDYKASNPPTRAFETEIWSSTSDFVTAVLKKAEDVGQHLPEDDVKALFDALETKGAHLTRVPLLPDGLTSAGDVVAFLQAYAPGCLDSDPSGKDAANYLLLVDFATDSVADLADWLELHHIFPNKRPALRKLVVDARQKGQSRILLLYPGTTVDWHHRVASRVHHIARSVAYLSTHGAPIKRSILGAKALRPTFCDLVLSLILRQDDGFATRSLDRDVLRAADKALKELSSNDEEFQDEDDEDEDSVAKNAGDGGAEPDEEEAELKIDMMLPRIDATITSLHLMRPSNKAEASLKEAVDLCVIGGSEALFNTLNSSLGGTVSYLKEVDEFTALSTFDFGKSNVTREFCTLFYSHEPSAAVAAGKTTNEETNTGQILANNARLARLKNYHTSFTIEDAFDTTSYLDSDDEKVPLPPGVTEAQYDARSHQVLAKSFSIITIAAHPFRSVNRLIRTYSKPTSSSSSSLLQIDHAKGDFGMVNIEGVGFRALSSMRHPGSLDKEPFGAIRSLWERQQQGIMALHEGWQRFASVDGNGSDLQSFERYLLHPVVKKVREVCPCRSIIGLFGAKIEAEIIGHQGRGNEITRSKTRSLRRQSKLFCFTHHLAAP